MTANQKMGVGVLVIGAAMLFAIEAVCTRARNEVWHDDQSLWADAVKKAPNDGRAWMNLGVAVMAKNDLRSAEEYFQVAKLCAPTYSLVYVNLGVLYGATGRDDLARLNFEEAIRLAPGDSNSYTYYNEWRRKIQSRGAK
jgi:tetratricopeptide (TPR) repeat protein